MGKDVDAAQPLTCRLAERFATLCCGQVGLDIFHALDGILDRAGGSNDTGLACEEAFDRGAAKPLGSAADEHTLTGELVGIGLDIHTVVSRVLMASCARVKR